MFAATCKYTLYIAMSSQTRASGGGGGGRHSKKFNNSAGDTAANNNNSKKSDHVKIDKEKSKVSFVYNNS